MFIVLICQIKHHQTLEQKARQMVKFRPNKVQNNKDKVHDNEKLNDPLDPMIKQMIRLIILYRGKKRKNFSLKTTYTHTQKRLFHSYFCQGGCRVSFIIIISCMFFVG